MLKNIEELKKMVKVVKFGGSSLASAEQFAKVGDIIRADESRKYVVPSAPGKRNSKDTKVTDMLYACYALAEADEDFRVQLMKIKERYDSIINGLGLKIIDNPQPIKVITYRELRELSYMGASVLHEDAVFPVRKAGIPINIRNTNDPEADGTLIVESTCQKPEYTITGIAGKKGFVAVGIDKDMMNAEVGFCRKALQAFEENGISIEHMPSGIDTMTVFVHQAEFEGKEQQVISSIRRLTHPDVIELEADLALIAVVGRGMKSTRGTAGRIFSALAHANINVKMIDQGSSELNIIIGVSNDDFEEAIKAIYDIFVETRL